MVETGKIIAFAGLLIALAGGIVWGLGRAGFRGLPGDIRYEGDNFRFYFPIVTCLALSVAVTLLIRLWQWLGKR